MTSVPVLILARGPSGRRRHWWRAEGYTDWSPLCYGQSWARRCDLDRESNVPICPRCARLVPDAPLLEAQR